MSHCSNGHERIPENLTADGRCALCRAVQRERRNAVLRERYRTDPEFAERARQRSRRHLANPKNRERKNAQRRERYHTDPEYRARNAESSAYHYRAKNVADRRRERYNADPEYRAHMMRLHREVRERRKADPERHAIYLEYERIRKQAARRAAGVPERNWSERSKRGEKGDGLRVSVEPLRKLLRALERANPDIEWLTLARRSGVPSRRIWEFRRGTAEGVTLRVVGSILDALDRPDWLLLLYPVEGHWQLPEMSDCTVKLRRVPPKHCLSGDRCREPAGHGYAGSFCAEHAAELNRIKAEL